jgi:hypothetical protein
VKAIAQTKLYAGKDAIFAPEVVNSLVGQRVNAWVVVEAELAAKDEILLTLEGLLPFKIHLGDKHATSNGSGSL